MNFDADYCAAVDTDKITQLPQNPAHILLSESMKAENHAISKLVGSYQQPRPQWDVQLLVDAGFERVIVDMGVHRRIYAEIDEFYNPTPIFTIAAYKPGKEWKG